MILKSIALENIRSYREPKTITFSTGASLFEGDVGSGKSSILSAIEFALFGLGDLDGRHLMRSGAKKGNVLLKFEVEGKPYQVCRSLTRRRTRVHQDEGYIIEDDVQTNYRPTELKARVLKILGFNESPNPRAQSVIYRYAIFTPQEMMKEVLTQKEDKRLETLRKAFRIEDYSRAIDNSAMLSSELIGYFRELKGATKDLPDKIVNLKEQRKNLKRVQAELRQLKSSLKKLEVNLEKLQLKINQSEEKQREVSKLESIIPILEQQIEDFTKQLKETKATIEELNNNVRETEKAQKTLDSLRPQYKLYTEGKKEIEGLEEAFQRHRSLSDESDKLTETIKLEKTFIKKSLKKMVGEIANLESEVGQLVDAVKETTKLREKGESFRKEVDRLDQVSASIISLQKKASATDTDLKSIQREINRKRREWKRIEDVGLGAPCPRCKQTLSEKHYLQVKADYKAEIHEFQDGRKTLRSSHVTLIKEVKTLEEEEKRLKEKRNNLQTLQERILVLEERKKTMMARQKTLDKQKKAMDRERMIMVEERFAEEERERIAEIQKLLKELKSSVKRYNELKENVQKLDKEKIEARYTEAKTKAERKDSLEQTLRQTKVQKKGLQESLDRQKQKLAKSKVDYEFKKAVKDKLQELQKKRKDLEEQRREQDRNIAAKKMNITNLNDVTEDLEEEIKVKERDKFLENLFGQVVIWLSNHLNPALESIERHILTTINHDFNALFQKWFGTLIESGDINVRVNENFTPYVEQEGYELEVSSLSGGERTSVALAYRLALNVMVKRTCEAMKNSLLILDEPTDGFSREQLFRLREILSELNCEQVIMVSHEKELESFVDHIYRVTKVGGVSEVEQIS